MPLRDHFHAPLADRRSWEGFHGGWPAMIVCELNRKLPERYAAEPRVHLGSSIEGDLASYEVRVYDNRSGRRLVTAIEIVCPANKDRPEHRRAFVAECAALLQERVCVVVVDIVTSRTANLFRDLLDLLGESGTSSSDEASPLYAVTCRSTRKDARWLMEAWMQTLSIGQPLPTLPLWLADDLAVPLDLDSSYEETCRILRLP
jgi:Protein of unknown function (DUF4058)